MRRAPSVSEVFAPKGAIAHCVGVAAAFTNSAVMVPE